MVDSILKLMRQQQRLCVFIDNSNLFHALRHRTDKRINYIKLCEQIASGRTIDVRFYYSDTGDDRYGDQDKRLNREKFYRFLSEHLKFNMIRLPLRERSGYNQPVFLLVKYLRSRGISDEEILRIAGQKNHWLQQIEGDKVAEEKGLDCEIVFDMSKLAILGRYDIFVLVSGDEDYARTISKIRTCYGIPTELVFFGSGACSINLQRQATTFLDLDTVPDLFV